MPESLGARLRDRRQQRQIALATIAEQTKIKLSLLEDLERDDVTHWPAGIFRRAFVRSYARAIGLDPEVILREFVTLYPDPADVPPAAGPGESTDGSAATGAPPTRLRSLVGSAMDSLTTRLRNPAPEPPRAAQVAATVTRPPEPEAPAAVEPAEMRAEPAEIRAELAEVSPEPAEVRAEVRAPEPDMLAVAKVCIELGQTSELSDAAPLLEEAAEILGAVGLIVWQWHPPTAALTPALAHGYSARAVAQLPRVEPDADNATAAAFRSGQTCVVNGNDVARGALVVPLLTAFGCAGVLAIELPNGVETNQSVRALATIFAAQLARVVRAPRPANAAERRRA
jgi:hypothetical protein